MLNKGLWKIGDGTFLECSSLESIKFSSTISEVRDGAFQKCSNLKDVLLNKGLWKIGKGAFDDAHLWKVSDFLPMSL